MIDAEPTALLRDPARLRVLAESGLLDGAPDEAFDRLARLASRVLRAPVAAVSLLDDHRQFFVSAVGLAEPWASRREVPLSHSFCRYALTSAGPMVIDDARRHPLLRGSPAIGELGAVAYVGVPLVTADAHALGTLCVVDPRPRRWSHEEVEILRELGGSAVREIELRLVARESIAAEQRYRALIAGLDAVVWEADFATQRLTYVSPQCEALSGQPASRWLGAPEFASELIHPDDVGAVTACYRGVWKGREMEVEFRMRSASSDDLWMRGRMRPVRSAAGPVVGVRGVLVDVTARKHAELALAAQTAAVALLQEVAIAANEAVSSDGAMQRCLSLVCGYLGWPVGHAYVRRDGALLPTELWHLARPGVYEPFRELTAATLLLEGQGLPGRVLATGQPAWIDDVSADGSFPRAATARAVGLRGGFACPVRVGPEVVAVLEFYSESAEAPDERARALMANVGTQLGRVVEREQHAAMVERRSHTDELTGLHNRRGFLELARQHLRVASRAGAPVLLCFIDMDGLKPINDRLGHEAGDGALSELAEVLRRTFRESDILARLGGDEFVVMAALAPEHAAEAIVARLHAQLAAFNAAAERPYALGVSVGVTVCDPSKPESIEALLARADALMYAQKRERKGRRRTSPP